MEAPEELDDAGYSVQVGERLRSIRKQKRLSLHDVEAQSNQEFKASVLGAYERLISWLRQGSFTERADGLQQDYEREPQRMAEAGTIMLGNKGGGEFV